LRFARRLSHKGSSGEPRVPAPRPVIERCQFAALELLSLQVSIALAEI
jgi:hypothetical protein